MSSNSISLDLSEDQALVLFAFLTRTDKAIEKLLEDQAEQRVLWDIEAMLEKALPHLFAENYGKLLSAARERVRDETDNQK